MKTELIVLVRGVPPTVYVVNWYTVSWDLFEVMKHRSGVITVSGASISTLFAGCCARTSPFQSMDGMSNIPAPMTAWRISTVGSMLTRTSCCT